MALPDDYKALINKWLTKTHTVGSPELDALIGIEGNTGTAKDFLFELAQGNIPGKSSFGFITKNDNVGTDRVDQWDDASMMVYPANDTISETWEIASTSPNDTNGGTGAWNAIIISLDDDFLRVTHTVDLNGTTPVTIPGLHTRPHQVILPDSGSSDTNEGKVTVRVSGSGLLRNTVRVGESLSFDGHFTVPADKKAFIMQTYTNFGKNLDGNARTTIKNASNPNASWLLATGLDAYQSFIPFEVKAFFPLATKTDLRVASSVTSGVGQVTVIFEIILVDL
tara:strand:- start:378 stop:1220 length:843 start_codon:yes stop_codon:yes gene_type:complete